MNAADVARAVKLSRGSNGPLKSLTKAYADGHLALFQMTRLALAPSFVPAESVPVIEDDGGDAATFHDDDFVTLLSSLSFRKEDIHRAAMGADASAWNELYRPLLLGTNPARIDAQLINRVLGSNHALVVPLPAFHRPTKSRVIPRGHVWWVDDLLKGERLICMPRRDGRPVLVAETGVVRDAVTCELCSRLYAELPGPLVLDLVVEGGVAGSRHVWLVDALPYIVLAEGTCDLTLAERHEILCALEVSGTLKRVGGMKILPKVVVDVGNPDGRETLARLRSEAVSIGRRGVVLKDPNSPYYGGISKQWRALEGAG